MAKKVVATLKTGAGKQYTKCIKMVKSEKTGAYVFQTQNIWEDDEIKNFFAQKKFALVHCELIQKATRGLPFVFLGVWVGIVGIVGIVGEIGKLKKLGRLGRVILL